MATAEIRYPEFGKRFSRLMDTKGWTTSKLAAVAGPDGSPVTFATISRLRNGNTRPRPALLTRLSELLDVSEDELIGTDAPMSRRVTTEAVPLFCSSAQVSTPKVIAPKAPPMPDTLEWRMHRIIALQKQIADAELAKTELATLIEQVGAELNRLKFMTEPTP